MVRRLSEYSSLSGLMSKSRSQDGDDSFQPMTQSERSYKSSVDRYYSCSSDSLNASSGWMMGSIFRSTDRARRLVSSGRRNLLRQNSSARYHSATSSTSSSLSKVGEETPLKPSSAPEEVNTAGPVDYDVKRALKSILFEKFVSPCLLFAPFAILAHYQDWGPNWIFWLNFLVMIPLAAILGDFTEEAALHTNETVGGLLNATFGNAVEVVVAIQALLANEIRVVQASMIGSIFSNLLLVLGCCFFFGGLKHKELIFNATAATANMGLLALSSIALVLPTPFAEYYEVQDEHVLVISRFAAAFLLFMYLQLLIFQLVTHSEVFDGACGETDNGVIQEEEEEEEVPSIPMHVALIGLFLTTLSVTFFSDFLVESIDDFCVVSGVSRTFVGLIILPIVGNAVEHITAVTVAMKDKMDLAMGGKLWTLVVALKSAKLCLLIDWFSTVFIPRSPNSRSRFLHADCSLCCTPDSPCWMVNQQTDDSELSAL